MKIRDVLRAKGSEVYSVKENDSLLRAVKLLSQHRVGALLVVDKKGGAAGIFSERDVLRHLNDSGGGLGDASVSAVMTGRSKLIVATPGDDLDYAMAVMTRNRVRHLPVVEDGWVVGMVSIGDLIKSLLNDKVHENKMLADYIAGTYPG